MKFVKRLFAAILILVFLLAGSVFVLITFYKKELTDLLTETLKESYGLNLKVDDINVSFLSNWPHASVQLKNVSLASDMDGITRDPILKARSVALSFNLEKMLHQQFTVKYLSLKDAEINLIRDKNGLRNFEFKKQVKDSTSSMPPIKFELNKISLKNVSFSFLNHEKEQRIEISFIDNAIKLQDYSDGLEARLDGKIFITGLLFNAKRGAFLHHTKAYVDLDVVYFKDTRSICVRPPSYTEISNHRYNLAALLDLSENKKLSLLIESKKVDYFKVGDLLTPKIRKIMSAFDVKKTLDAKVLVKVNLGKREDPILLVNVEGYDNDLIIGNSRIPYSDLSFKGSIVSLHPSHACGDIAHAKLKFEKMKGKIYDYPFTADVLVKNLLNPYIIINGNILVEASKIKFEIAKDFVLKGAATAKIRYAGPTEKLNKKQFLEKPMNLKASITFKNLSYKEIDRPYVYTVNGKATLNNRDLKFDDLQLSTDVANVILKGRAENFMSYVLGDTKGFKASLAARTEDLNLNPLFKNSESPKTDSEQPETNGKSKSTTNMNSGQFEFIVNLYAKKLTIKTVEAQNASVYLTYKNNFLDIRSVNVNTCDGKIVAKGSIDNFSKLKADVSIHDVNVNKLFTQFGNFGQTAVESSNLKGNIFVEAKVSLQLDEKMGILDESMAVDAKVKLKDGHLINFEPIQNLSNFLFRNRDFNDVAFTEINETLKIKGNEIKIEELEIGSNVLNLYVVNGLYNLKGNSNINILVPWSNLKKRGKSYIPKNSGESAENTKGLKLNFYGPNKQMKISMGHKEQEKRFW